MSDETSARKPAEGEAPLMPGGEPEQAGTGPRGAIRQEDGNVNPQDVHPEYDQPSGATTTDGTPSPAVNRGVEDDRADNSADDSDDEA